MKKEKKYYGRELSYLSFNKLVLEQIKDKKLPLYERIKFLAIYASNIEEFYKVRVAYHRSLVGLTKESYKDIDYSPEKTLKEIKDVIYQMQKEYDKEFYNVILPEMDESGIIIYQGQELEEQHKDFLKDYFSKELLPEIQPVLLSSSGAVLSFLKDNVIYLAIKMWKKNRTDEKKANYAVILVPTRALNRFIMLPKYKGKFFFMFLEDIIREHLHIIFPGYDIEDSYSIKLSRNADLLIEDEFSGNLLNKLRKSLKLRKIGIPARFLHDKNIPDDFIHVLKLAFNLTESDFVPAGKYLNFVDFFQLPNPYSPKHELEPLRPLNHPMIDRYDSILEAVNKHDLLLHFPYHTYDYVLRFFSEAAIDPDVDEIKTTQYRVATNSAIVNALITAARNGKDVTVFVEVKARFDEAVNIELAEKMEDAGIHVIAGLPGLKVHAKAALVIRKSKTKKDNRKAYAFVSTGNFNEKTATQYSDEGFFTSDKRIIRDLENLFLYLETPVEQFKFKHILVPRFNMLDVIKEKIKRESDNVKSDKKGHIIFKMNGIGDKEMINILYDTNQKGVEIDLIVRGICKLRPGMSFSKNIKVTRIVDRFLEHSRIFAFYNNGDWEVYISSADMLTRNLRRRVESVIPIFDKELIKEIITILHIQLKDNTKAKWIDKDNNNIDKNTDASQNLYRAQIDTYLYLQKKTMMG